MIPIWKDYYVDLGQPTALFKIHLGSTASGEVIYEGKAFAAPDENNARIRINDICADYMAAHSLPDFEQQDFQPQLLTEIFCVEKMATPSVVVDVVEFLADWSYEYGWTPAEGMSYPIAHRVDERQRLFVALATDEQSINAVITMKDGTSYTKSLTILRTADFNADYNEDYAREEGDAPYGVVSLNLADCPNAARVELLGHTYIVEGCHRYALAYVNAHGGWDSFLPSRYELKSDNYGRHSTRVRYDNSNPSSRGILNFENEIVRNIRFNTGTLTDEGAANMHHLLGSTCVYLQDLKDGYFYPVTIEASSVEYKTFRNQGGKRVSYSFSVALAVEMVRR